jgi:hypothetical protein
VRPQKDSTDWPKIAVYDIEAPGWINVKLVCHVDEYGARRSFPTIAAYVDFLFSDEFKGTHVWAHFGGRYDHRFLIPEFYARGWDFKAALSGGSIVILSATSLKGRKIQFADSYRIMPEALKKIGKTINLEKLEVDYALIDEMSEEALLAYCFRDCDIVFKGLQYMRDVLVSVGADFAFTLASIATRWVRRSPVVDFDRFYRPKPDGGGIEYDPKMIYADLWCEGRDRPPQTKCPSCGEKGKWAVPLQLADAPDNAEGYYYVCRKCGKIIDKTKYSAYHGGRTEMFYDSNKQGIIKGPVYYHDVVSSYPWSMTNELPLYLEGFYPPPKGSSRADIERFLSYYGVTEAWVRVPRCVAGPLALQQENKPLIFPSGSFQGRFTNIELLAALHRGAEIRLGWQCRFEPKAFLRPFVQTFFGLRRKARQDKDEFRAYAFKILQNSLYGKLVETIDRCSYASSRAEIDRAKEAGGIVESTKISGVYTIKTREEGPFRHVAAGAYVTAYSRLKLLEGIEWVLNHGGQVYYCDTDSIMSSIPIEGDMAGTELGQWQPEYVFSEVEILLPKVYRAVIQSTGKTIYRCKGLPIVRENEPPESPELRWNAYKHYSQIKDDPAKSKEAAEMVALLSREGITGFVADINAGVLEPRAMVDAPGPRHVKPLLRAMQSSDRKREWSVLPSQPLTLDSPQAFSTPEVWARAK